MKGQKKIPLARPKIGRAEEKAVIKVLRSRYLTQGPKVAELELAAKEVLGRPVVAVSSGGAALLLALAQSGIGPGSEVIVPGFTFPAAAQAALWLGADPVPADVCEETFSLTPVSVQGRWSARTRAVVVAHAFGIPAEVEEVAEVAKKKGAVLIEDAACAFFGKTAGGSLAGTVGDFGCFSLHPRKSVTGGEGGLIACAEKDEQALRQLRDYGRALRGFGDVFHSIGLNFRLSDILAAVAHAQIGRFKQGLSRRQKLVRAYLARLDGNPFIHVPKGYYLDGQTFQSFVVRVADAKKVAEELKKNGIESGPAAYSLTAQSFFCRRYDVRRFSCPVSEMLARQALALPLYDEMGLAEVEAVCDALIATTKSLGKEVLP